MELQHYYTLYPAYGIALLGWTLLAPRLAIEPGEELLPFEKPWKEFLLSLTAIVLCLGIGQLYIKGLLFPRDNDFRFLLESLNHLLIFAPFPLLLLIRKQAFISAWIPARDLGKSIGLGLFLAILAIFLFLLLKGKIAQFLPVLTDVYHYKNLPLLVQVFLEDLAIAICFIRFQALIGERWAMIIVASLFALGHIPAMLSEGFTAANALGLLLDAMLVVSVLLVLRRWRNILWFWMIHYAMDMMQFVE